MNKLISQEKQYEIINQILEFLNSDTPIKDISEFLEDEIRNINKNHKDIGLKDTNGKSIYADSSIVEFRKSEELGYGYFVYNAKEARYAIKVVSANEIYNGLELPFVPHIMQNFKIVDTIQENKLGLIKA